MGWPDATLAGRVRSKRRSPPERPAENRLRDRARWYVPGALGEEIAISARPHRLRGSRARVASLVAAAVLATGVSACGGAAPRQDAGEPSGEFPVEVVSAKFPTEQRLAQTRDLGLEIENSGSEDVPNLAVTIRTGDQPADGPFSVRSEQPGLANSSRPVWILENGFPKPVFPGEKDLDNAPGGGATRQTRTFAFGSLPAGESRDIVWRVTPVQTGTYTVKYEVAAGLNGKATAVTDDGSPVEGEFVVTITGKVPRIEVDGSGQVEIQGP